MPDDETLKKIPKLMSPTAIRKFCLTEVGRIRPGWGEGVTRVSAAVVEAAEANARAFLRSRIQAHPSKGVTLT